MHSTKTRLVASILLYSHILTSCFNPSLGVNKQKLKEIEVKAIHQPTNYALADPIEPATKSNKQLLVSDWNPDQLKVQDHGLGLSQPGATALPDFQITASDYKSAGGLVIHNKPGISSFQDRRSGNQEYPIYDVS